MEHVVFFPAADGTAFRRLPSLEEAVRLVEHLRNVEGVDEATVHALTEVPLSFRAYYRVEVPAAASAAAPRSSEARTVPAQAAPREPAATGPVPPQGSDAGAAPTPAHAAEPVRAASGRGKDGPGSVGFFA